MKQCHSTYHICPAFSGITLTRRVRWESHFAGRLAYHTGAVKHVDLGVHSHLVQFHLTNYK